MERVARRHDGLPNWAPGFAGEAKWLAQSGWITLQADGSPAVMERLRAYATRHRRRFTVGVELRLGHGAPRWMRLLGAPVCFDGASCGWRA